MATATMLVLLALTQTGMLASLDHRLTDWRLTIASHPVSDTTIVVEIDSASLAEIGVWPWPRGLHATLLDRLLAAGVDEVAFDIDFSSSSDPFDDALFTAALERAGGYAWLAAFAQTGADGQLYFSRPLPEFAAAADPVLVNVLLDPLTGTAHSLPIAATDAEGTIPALAVQLARVSGPLPDILEIDFSLDLAGLQRVSFTDILYGRVDPAILAGKQIIVGASAIELRDFFTVPRYGVIPGPVLQALTLETLKAGRVLTNLGSLPGTVIVFALVLISLFWLRKARLPVIFVALVAISLIGEALAALAFAQAGLMISTASLHMGLFLLLGLAVADNGYHHLQARRSAQQRLQFMATHDAATGLLSRQGLIELPPHATPQLLVLLQLQATDELRATLGHDVVENVIRQFAHRLSHAGFAEIARTAPSTFALANPDNGDADQMSRIARQLCSSLSGEYHADEHHLHVEIVAGYASGADSRDELLNRAEIALIQARADRVKARGFSPSDQTALDRHRQLDRDLRRALSRNQLRLNFQPQVDLRTRNIIGAEALMRWDHPELGSVSPTEFIPLAEETGLIVELGRWILREACQQAASWPSPITVAVNVSPVQFHQADIAVTVAAALHRSGLPASRLELEITESSRVTDPARVHAVMWQLRKLGVRLAIDDFGTGYSSLSYFRDLPFDLVKIDQSFVRDRTSAADRSLLAAIIDLSAKMDKLTIAEGVEDENAARLLAEMGCTYGQGYYFSRPISGTDLCDLLTQPAQREQTG
ncbi:EAL domain-containing protein [Devosia sp. XK-2]|uniref:putative bifunctional diguanylate cyclase/phosphodiesterase n=1 Tax=Devosia sp. XK-2 TaxID=3126689 RepID=UPI0030D1E851